MSHWWGCWCQAGCNQWKTTALWAVDQNLSDVSRSRGQDTGTCAPRRGWPGLEAISVSMDSTEREREREHEREKEKDMSGTYTLVTHFEVMHRSRLHYIQSKRIYECLNLNRKYTTTDIPLSHYKILVIIGQLVLSNLKP